MDSPDDPRDYDFTGDLEARFEQYQDEFADNSPYAWENFGEFLHDLHDKEVDHSYDSDLAHFLVDVGLRDEEADYDVGDTP